MILFQCDAIDCDATVTGNTYDDEHEFDHEDWIGGYHGDYCPEHFPSEYIRFGPRDSEGRVTRRGDNPLGDMTEDVFKPMIIQQLNSGLRYAT